MVKKQKVLTRPAVPVVVAAASAAPATSSAESAALTLINSVGDGESAKGSLRVYNCKLDAIIHDTNNQTDSPDQLALSYAALERFLSDDATSDASKTDVGRSGLIDSIITAIQRFQDETELRKSAAAALLAAIVDHKDNAARFVACGGIPIIAALAKESPSDNEFALILAALLVEDEWKSAVGDAGGIAIFLDGLTRHINSVKFQAAALQALFTLIYEDESRRDFLIESGGIQPIIATMNKYSDVSTIQESGINALRFIVVDEADKTNKQRVLESGGLTVAVAAIKRFIVQERLVGTGCVLIMSLFKAIGCTSPADGNTAIEAISAAIKQHIASDRLLNTACSALYDIAYSNELPIWNDIIIKTHLIKQLLSIMKRYIEYPSILINSYGAIAGFIHENEILQLLFIELNGIKILIDGIRKNIKISAIITIGIQLLGNLCNDHKIIRKTIGENGGIGLIFNALYAHINNQSLIALCYHALWTFANEKSGNNIRIQNSNGIHFTIDLIKKYNNNNEKILNACYGLLSVLSNNQDIADQLIQLNCLNLIFNSLQTFKNSISLPVTTCQIIDNMVRCKLFEETMININGIPIIIDLMKLHSSNNTIESTTILPSTTLSSTTSTTVEADSTSSTSLSTRNDLNIVSDTADTKPDNDDHPVVNSDETTKLTQTASAQVFGFLISLLSSIGGLNVRLRRQIINYGGLELVIQEMIADSERRTKVQEESKKAQEDDQTDNSQEKSPEDEEADNTELQQPVAATTDTTASSENNLIIHYFGITFLTIFSQDPIIRQRIQETNIIYYLEKSLSNITDDSNKDLIESIKTLRGDDIEMNTCLSDNICTYSITGSTYRIQQWYRCLTCEMEPNTGCCIPCSRTCHKGHDLLEVGVTRFFCDCATMTEPIKCTAMPTTTSPAIISQQTLSETAIITV